MAKTREFKNIILQKEAGVASLILNRPRQLNALNDAMIEELLPALQQIERDGEVRVMVLIGAGRFFSIGGDFGLLELRHRQVSPRRAGGLSRLMSDLKRGKVWQALSQAILAIQRLDKPTIAMINGDATGGGFNFALACDIRFASPRASFKVASTQVGLPDDTGGCWFLPRLVGTARALEILYSGDLISAEEALRLGLINHLVPADKLEAETMAFARRLAQGPPIAYRFIKRLVYRGLETDLETALEDTLTAVGVALKSRDHKEGLRAVVEKRPPAFKDR